MSKKIVIVGPAFPLRGGIADFNETLSKQLLREENEVHLFSFSLQYPKLLFPGKSQYREDSIPPQLNIQSTINSINPLSWIRTAKAINNLRADFVVFRYWLPFMAPALGFIARRIKTKKIAITDNIIPHEHRLGDRMLSSFFIKQCDAFICMSKSVKEDLKGFNVPEEKISFTPHPVYDIFGESCSKEMAAKELQLDPEVNYLLFFGFIRKYKGLDLLLKGFALSGLAEENTKLIVAGEFYENKEIYLKLCEQLGLNGKVIFHDHFIADEKVRFYFGVSDMITQTYLSATQSGVTQIAYYFDKPMLVTDVGGLSEIVPHQKVGYVCDLNEKSVADALKDFYHNKRASEFIHNISTEKQKFSWKHFTSKLTALADGIN